MGRPRKTTTELKLSGTFNQHSSRKNWNTETPYQLTDKPSPSRYLKRTQMEWHKFMTVKTVQGVLSIEDESMLIMMFDSLDLYFRMTDEVYEFHKSPDYKDRISDWKERAMLKDLDKMRSAHLQDFTKIACRFGISPTERSRMTLPEQEQRDELLELVAEEL